MARQKYMVAKVFPHKHEEGRHTRYHIYDDETEQPWCTTEKRSIFDNQPITMADFDIELFTFAPGINMCQTCLRQKQKHDAALRTIEERRKRIVNPTPTQQQLL